MDSRRRLRSAHCRAVAVGVRVDGPGLQGCGRRGSTGRLWFVGLWPRGFEGTAQVCRDVAPLSTMGHVGPRGRLRSAGLWARGFKGAAQVCMAVTPLSAMRHVGPRGRGFEGTAQGCRAVWPRGFKGTAQICWDVGTWVQGDGSGLQGCGCGSSECDGPRFDASSGVLFMRGASSSMLP